MDHIALFSKLASLPENLKIEVSDFIDFLKSKTSKKEPGKKPKFGSARGLFVIKPGFDDPIDDFNEYMNS